MNTICFAFTIRIVSIVTVLYNMRLYGINWRSYISHSTWISANIFTNKLLRIIIYVSPYTSLQYKYFQMNLMKCWMCDYVVSIYFSLSLPYDFYCFTFSFCISFFLQNFHFYSAICCQWFSNKILNKTFTANKYLFLYFFINKINYPKQLVLCELYTIISLSMYVFCFSVFHIQNTLSLSYQSFCIVPLHRAHVIKKRQHYQ